MKKEIKFRGLRTDGKGWVYGSLSMVNTNSQRIGDKNHGQMFICAVQTRWQNLDNGKKFIGDWTEVIPESVGQFTSLIDKNGIEIYEGDYLVERYPVDDEDLDASYHESLLPVVWCDVKLQWCVDASFAKDGSYLTSLVEYFGNYLEVKGNIYENPQP